MVRVRVIGPNGVHIMEENTTGEGLFTFSALRGGNHVICVTFLAPTKMQNYKLKYQLRLQIGDDHDSSDEK